MLIRVPEILSCNPGFICLHQRSLPINSDVRYRACIAIIPFLSTPKEEDHGDNAKGKGNTKDVNSKQKWPPEASQASSRLQLKPLVISSPKQGKLCLKITLTRHEIAAIMQIQNKASPATFAKVVWTLPPSPPFYNVVSGPSPTLYHGGEGGWKWVWKKCKCSNILQNVVVLKYPAKKGFRCTKKKIKIFPPLKNVAKSKGGYLSRNIDAPLRQ